MAYLLMWLNKAYTNFLTGALFSWNDGPHFEEVNTSITSYLNDLSSFEG